MENTKLQQDFDAWMHSRLFSDPPQSVTPFDAFVAGRDTANPVLKTALTGAILTIRPTVKELQQLADALRESMSAAGGFTPVHLPQYQLVQRPPESASVVSTDDEGPTARFNAIPEMTDPQGKHWQQPADIRLAPMDDNYVRLTLTQLEGLLEYNSSYPSGKYYGKCWKREDGAGAWLCWYEPCDKPGLIGIGSREIVVIVEQAPAAAEAVEHYITKEDEVHALAVQVKEKCGWPIAKALLQLHGTVVLQNLNPIYYDAFIADCKRLLGGKLVAGL